MWPVIRYQCALGIVFLLLGCGSKDGSMATRQGNGVPPGGARTTLVTPAPGNPNGTCTIPAEAMAENTSAPTTVVGTGTPESCTPAALESAIHKGGIVTFNGGPDPVTITLEHTIMIYNDWGRTKTAMSLSTEAA